MLSWAGPTDAGNRGSAFLSNQAAMTGEAVAAHIDDAGAAWYNPAGLASLDRTSLDLSASAFLLRRYDIHEAAQTRLGGGPVTSEDARFTEVVSIPSALTYVRALGPGLTGALGVFVPDAEDLDVTADFDTGAGASPSYRWNLTATRRTSTYLAGPSLGWRMAPSVRLGVSVLASYATTRTSRVFQSTFEDPASSTVTDSVLSLERTSRLRRFGGLVTLGTQIEPGGGWRLGVVARSPHFVFGVLDNVRQNANAARVSAAGGPQIDGTTDQDDSEETTFRTYLPPRFTLSVGHALGAGWLAIEGDLEPGLEDESLGTNRKAVWNARAGGRVPLSEDLSLGAGVFTDRSPQASPASLGDMQVDFYGMSIGAQVRNAHGLREDTGHVVFSTTVALRYARGSGHVGGLFFDPSTEPVPRQASVTVHEIGLHVGSAIEL